VELAGDQSSADKVRKRDVLFSMFGTAKTSLSQVAEQVYKHEALQKTAARVSGAVAGTGAKVGEFRAATGAKVEELKAATGAKVGEIRAATGAKVGEMQAAISTKAGQLGELTAERKTKYTGWVMEKMATPAAGAAVAVGFFLARKEGQESSFDACRKQERVEVVDISARNCIKTTLIVQPGDTLNWTFGALASAPSCWHALPITRRTFLCWMCDGIWMRCESTKKGVVHHLELHLDQCSIISAALTSLLLCHAQQQ
jgi:hypothetical protein